MNEPTLSPSEVTLRRTRWVNILSASAERMVFPQILTLVRTGSAADRIEFVRSFRDDAGHRRAIDSYFLSHLLKLPITTNATVHGEDCKFWTEVCQGNEPLTIAQHNKTLQSEIPAAAWMAAVSDDVVVDARSLAPSARRSGLEVWTEIELCCLHILWTLPQSRARCAAAAQWLMEELQPDNATNHPWAIHVFAELGSRGDMQADLYAQTLLHNAEVGGGGVYAGLILLHAAMIMDM